MPVCPSCETSVPEERYLETYIAPFNNQEYKLYHCPKCDLQWWEPLKIVSEYYEHEVEKCYFHMGTNQTIGEKHKMFFKHMPLKSGRLLDVGCGDGIFLAEAQKRGYEVWGIDLVKNAIQICQENRGLKNTFAMSLQEFAEFCQKESLKFHIITFFEVLEHQDKPREFLEAIKSMLKPGGWIAGSVPNRELLRFSRKSLNYMHYNFPPNHFPWFNKSAISNLFVYSGFKSPKIWEVDSNNFLKRIWINTARLESALTGVKGELLKAQVRRLAFGNKPRVGSSIARRFIFGFLKFIRNMFFLSGAICLDPFVVGSNLYFQSSLER